MKYLPEGSNNSGNGVNCSMLCGPNDGACEWLCITNCKQYAFNCMCPVQNGDVQEGCSHWDEES